MTSSRPSAQGRMEMGVGGSARRGGGGSHDEQLPPSAWRRTEATATGHAEAVARTTRRRRQGDMEAVTARDGRIEATARRQRQRGTNGWSQGQVVGERGRRTRRRHARGGGDLLAPDGIPCTEAVAARLGCCRVPCRHPHPPPSVPAQRGRCSSWLRSSPSPRPPPPPPPRHPQPLRILCLPPTGEKERGRVREKRERKSEREEE
ncbi:hypothetical protein [Oryza sativa Japonica Group]|uniref:Uncharacterized protein P0034C09.31 n=1 Tax=Oryza sativa subsp. japonica TaxID=39947 RepID=Q5N7R3_ORYSJ|nr:hypothetical protein [Oryza sativa Japonica Group]